MATATETAIITAQVPVARRRELLRLAGEGDRTLSQQVRIAVREHLERRQDITEEEA